MGEDATWPTRHGGGEGEGLEDGCDDEVWMALVASTHSGEALSRSPVPMWFGDQGFENYSILLSGGVEAAGSVPVARMM